MLILKSCSIQSGLRKAVSQRREATSWKYGEVSHDRKDATWMGPVKGRAGEDEPDTDYPGNIKTPNWMLGENGDEIAEKMKVLFKGYDPTLKKPIANFRMRLAPGKATAAPPVGPSFSQMGAKPIDFIKAYNDATMGLFVPDPELKLKVYVRFYEDKTYQWKVLPPTTAWLIRKAAGLPAIGVSGFGAGNPPQISGKWAGYITLQQLYHVAALANTWNNFPDWLPLEFRVDGLIKQADVQGICVLGVHSAPPPMLGKSDAQQYEYIREMKKKWTDDRLKEMDRNPLDRLPWATKITYRNTTGFDLVAKPDKRSVIKDAQAIDKKFQTVLDKQAGGEGGQKGKVLWDEWKKTGNLIKLKETPTTIEQRHMDWNKRARVDYLSRRYPSVIARHRNYRAMWFSDEWENLQANSQHIGERVR